jgi:PAS domain S-box-containing protein
MTERARSRRGREPLLAALDQMADGVIVSDAGGTITYANASFLAWSGFSLDDLLGHDAASIAEPLLGSDNLAALLKAAVAGAPWTSDTDVARPDGSVRHVELTVTPVRDSSATVMGHVIIELRPAFVKLDLTLVRGVDGDLSRRAMVVGMLHFASEAGCETIAEGVETVEELDVLRSLGVRLAQGYLLGRPEDADATAAGSPGGVT